MLTALGVAFLLSQPDPSCVGCGGTGPGGFPVGHGHGSGYGHRAIKRVLDYCKGDLWGLQAQKCACTLGTYVPGGDNWALQMHGGVPVSAPVITPAPAPTPAPSQAPAPTPAPGSRPAGPRNPGFDPGLDSAPMMDPPAGPDDPGR